MAAATPPHAPSRRTGSREARARLARRACRRPGQAPAGRCRGAVSWWASIISPRNALAMKVLILGAGVIGTCTAWYLTRQGHEVTVIERRDGAGLETSFANGGSSSVWPPGPRAPPAAPSTIIQMISRDDA